MRLKPFLFRVSVLTCLMLLPLSPVVGQVESEDLTGDSAASGNLEQLERLAEESFVEDDLDTAIVLYRQLLRKITVRGEKVRILMTIAWLEHLQRQDSAALDTLTDALILQPDYTFRPELYSDSFRQLFHRGRQRAAEARDRRAADRIRRGFELLKAEDYPAAREALQESLELVPGHPKALYNLALVDLYDERSDEAVAGFQKLLALAESGAEVSASMRSRALTNLGFLFNQQGNYQDAEASLQRAVELDASDASSWSNLGVTQRRLGNLQGAAEAFRQAYQLDPEDAGVTNNLALAYIDDKDWVSAVALLREATRTFPDNASLWLNLGLSQMGLGNQEGAVTSLERAIQQDPDDRQGWASAATIHLARHYYEAGQSAAALAAADRALQWRGDLVNGWIYRGLAQRGLGQSEAALESLQQARNLEPTRAETHNNLGSIYADLGRLDEARSAFQQALTLDPELLDAQQNLKRIEGGGSPSSGSTSSRSTTRPASPPPPRNRASTTPRSTARSTKTSASKDRPAPRKAPPLGLRFADIDYSSLGLKGAMVEGVRADSVAERGGLRSGDLILKVDGQDVLGPEELESYVAERPHGSQVTVDFLRANVPQRLVLVLE